MVDINRLKKVFFNLWYNYIPRPMIKQFFFIAALFFVLTVPAVLGSGPSVPIKNVVFSGGGTPAGYVAIGALSVLETRPEFQPTRWAGAEIGSVIAVLNAVGYNSTELFGIFFGTSGGSAAVNYTQVGLDVISRYGALRNHELISQAVNFLILQKTGIFGATFAQLPQDITISAMNYSSKGFDIVYFNKETTPSMKISDAVIYSSTSIFLYRASKYDGNTYVDPSYKEQYPISLFRLDPFKTIGVNTQINTDSTLLTSIAHYTDRLYDLHTQVPVPILLRRRTIDVEIDPQYIRHEHFLGLPELSAFHAAGIEAALDYFN